MHYISAMYQIELTEEQIKTILFCLTNISESTVDYLNQQHFPPEYLVEMLQELLEDGCHPQPPVL